MIKYFKGIAYAFIVATAAVLLGGLVPLVGAPVFGIVLGLIAGSIFGKPSGTQEGLRFTSKKILQTAIVLLGAGLSFSQIFKVGVDSLYVMLFTISAAFLIAFIFGKILKLPFNISSLIGTGTAICGASAIAAVSPIIDADDKDISYSISTVFFFNVIAVLAFPALGRLIGMSDNSFGLWSGTAINDTSSVVAAGYSFSDAAGAYATIVKLTRTTMIIPISLIFTGIVFFTKRKNNTGSSNIKYRFSKIFPWFVLFFLIASLINTSGILGNQLPAAITGIGKYLIVLALSAIGLNSNVKSMFKTGPKPMLLGMAVWIGVTLTSLLVQSLTGLM